MLTISLPAHQKEKHSMSLMYIEKFWHLYFWLYFCWGHKWSHTCFQVTIQQFSASLRVLRNV